MLYHLFSGSILASLFVGFFILYVTLRNSRKTKMECSESMENNKIENESEVCNQNMHLSRSVGSPFKTNFKVSSCRISWYEQPETSNLEEKNDINSPNNVKSTPNESKICDNLSSSKTSGTIINDSLKSLCTKFSSPSISPMKSTVSMIPPPAPQTIILSSSKKSEDSSLYSETYSPINDSLKSLCTKFSSPSISPMKSTVSMIPPPAPQTIILSSSKKSEDSNLYSETYSPYSLDNSLRHISSPTTPTVSPQRIKMMKYQIDINTMIQNQDIEIEKYVSTRLNDLNMEHRQTKMNLAEKQLAIKRDQERQRQAAIQMKEQKLCTTLLHIQNNVATQGLNLVDCMRVIKETQDMHMEEKDFPVIPKFKQFLHPYMQAIKDLATEMGKNSPDVQVIDQILKTSQFIEHLVGEEKEIVDRAIQLRKVHVIPTSPVKQAIAHVEPTLLSSSSIASDEATGSIAIKQAIDHSNVPAFISDAFVIIEWIINLKSEIRDSNVKTRYDMSPILNKINSHMDSLLQIREPKIDHLLAIVTIFEVCLRDVGNLTVDTVKYVGMEQEGLDINQDINSASKSNNEKKKDQVVLMQDFVLHVFERILDVVTKAQTETSIMLLAYLTDFVCNVHKRGNKMVYGLLLLQNNLCVPLCDTKFAKEKVGYQSLVSQSVGRRNLMVFFSCMIANSENLQYFDKKTAWHWMVQICKQAMDLVQSIDQLLKSPNGDSNKKIFEELSENIRDSFAVIRNFLRYVASKLVKLFGDKFLSLFNNLQQLLHFPNAVASIAKQWNEVDKLKVLLTEFSAFGNKIPVICFEGQDSFVICAQVEIRSLGTLQDEAASFDADKSPRAKAIKDHLEIIRIPKAFNILGPTDQSKQDCIDMLYEKIEKAHNMGDLRLIRYVLFKVTSQALKFCQSQQFKLSSSGEYLGIAISGVCKLFPNVAEMFKMQFFHNCPFTIPKFFVVGSTADEYRASMGFLCISREENGKAAVWETPDNWIGRMSKLLGVYAYVLIQANGESSSFGIEAAWVWLVRVVNFTLRSPDSPTEATAKMLEVFLSVTSNALYQKYRIHFLSILKIIKEQIVPKLNVNGTLLPSILSHKEVLLDFLERFNPQ